MSWSPAPSRWAGRAWPGGGRKRAADLDPGLRVALLALVEPEERGDPMSPLRWTVKSTRNLADELTRQGHRVGADTVGDLLREEGFSLQGNAKTIEGQRHPDRDAQFRYINEQVKAHQGTADPVISVDTKKKELVGEFKNAGRQWRPAGQPEATRTHDFPGDSAGKAVPYGVYDLTADAGWVSVGTDHDTAAFAVESIRRWRKGTGHSDYPQARRLLITTDAGGSNGYRTRAWKAELAALAVQTGLEITCCHFPPGTSKWNKVEHRLFSHITMNWRGRPLTSHEVIVQTIAATTTRTGLRVRAELDTSAYDTGVQISDAQMDALPLARHDWHGDWNYTLRPQAYDQVLAPYPSDRPSPDLAWLCHPALTGLTAPERDALIAAGARSQPCSGPGPRSPSDAASRSRNAPTRSPSWAGCRNTLSRFTVYMTRRPMRVRVRYPAASRSATMAWTVRSVRPTTGLMSRMRALGLRAISTRTCPWPVSSVQVPPLWSGSLMLPEYTTRGTIIARQNARSFSRVLY